MPSINGNVTVRGHTVDVNDSFFQIVDKSNSLLAWMSYFEARKGPFALFTDVVWEDLGFPGHANDDFNKRASRQSFARFPNIGVSVDANLHINAHAQLDYQSTIIQSGAAYEVAKWSGPTSRTALDVLAGARYWNQSVDTSVSLTGNLAINASAEATFDPRDLVLRVLRKRGFHLNRQAAKLLKRLVDKRFGPGKNITIKGTEQIDITRALALDSTGDLEWVDPFVGFRVRHAMGSSKELSLEGDIGGFGVGSQFSWQVVAAYGFDSSLCGTPFHGVIGYRALAVDYSENSRYGSNGLNFVEHGPLLGVTFRW